MQDIAQSPSEPILLWDVLNSDFDVSNLFDDLDSLQDAPLDCTTGNARALHEEPTIKNTKVAAPFETAPTLPPACHTQRTTSWSRRKQELQRLRCEAEALETRIIFLNMEANRRKATRHENSFVNQGMWQSVALIARQECEKARCENARLKRELQSYARTSDMIQRQLVTAASQLRQLCDTSASLADSSRLERMRNLQWSVNHDCVFHMLEERINARSFETEFIMNEARFTHEIEGTFEQVEVCRDGGLDHAAAVELRHARLLPFGEEATAKAVWKAVNLWGVLTKVNTLSSKSTADMIMLVARHTVPLGISANVSVEMHSVIKRLPTAAGLIALVESHSEWLIEDPASGFAHSTTEEGGWIMVHEDSYSSRSETQQASQLRTFVKLRLDKMKTDERPNSLTSIVVDVIIPSFCNILRSHHQSVENFVVDSERTAS